MKIYLELTHDEIQNQIPYAIIAETTCRSIWNTGRRKRAYAAAFTETEREHLCKIRRQAYMWALVKGVPAEGVRMTPKTYDLWQKFADFCASL